MMHNDILRAMGAAQRMAAQDRDRSRGSDRRHGAAMEHPLARLATKQAWNRQGQKVWMRIWPKDGVPQER